MRANKKKSTNKFHLVIWDSDVPAQYFGQGYELVTERKGLNEKILSNYSAIFILAEIRWEGKKRIDFFGLSLVKEFRVAHKLTCPIIICSFIPTFEESRILDTPGHYLLQLPEILSKLNNYEGIDLQTLQDINLDIFHPLADAKRILHDLPNDSSVIATKSVDKEEIKTSIEQKVKQEFIKIEHRIAPDKKNEFGKLINHLIDNLRSEIDKRNFKPDDVRIIFENHKQQIYNQLPQIVTDEANELPTEVIPKRWKVLIIDDQQETCDTLRKLFVDRGINCEIATNGLYAFKILNNDMIEGNLISVIISDFRLYENGEKGRWQKMQGYKIFSTIFESTTYNSPYSYVMLTSRKGTILEQIKKQLNFRILWFHKADVLPDKLDYFDRFFQEVCEVGSETFSRKRTLPESIVWTKGTPRVKLGYAYFYKLHIEAPDYEKSEEAINKSALENIEFAIINEKLKDKFDIGITLNFKGIIGNNNEKEVLLKKFRANTLLVRRISYGLLAAGKSWEEIFNIIKYDYHKNINKNNPSAIKQNFNNYLGISTKSEIKGTTLFRNKKLLEEIDFLEQHKDRRFFIEELIDSIINDDMDYLCTFFEILNENNEIVKRMPVVHEMFIKLDKGTALPSDHILKVINSIGKQIRRDERLLTIFKNITEYFYKYDLENLSERYQKKLLALKAP